MKFGIAYSPTTPLSPITHTIRWVIIVSLILMATSQLISYEKFVPLIQNYQLLDSPAFGKLLAALIVVSEVLALPFLLRMNISPLLRIVSAGSLVLTSAVWCGVSLWAAISSSPTAAGVLGGYVKHISSGVALSVSTVFMVASFIIVWYLRRDFKK